MDMMRQSGQPGSKIYDRWGNQVSESSRTPFGWDGRFEGSWMQPGVYVYAVEMDYIVNGREFHTVLTGDVT